MNNAENIKQKLRNVFVPSLLTGIISAGAFYVMAGDQFSISVPTMIGNIPAWSIVSGGATLGNMIGEVANEFVAPYLPHQVQSIEPVLPPAMAAMGTGLVFKGLAGVPMTSVPLTTYGSIALASVAGNYLNEHYVKKM